MTPLALSALRLNAVARREQSLGLFHALGKVLYNKSEHNISSKLWNGDSSLVLFTCATGIGDAAEDGTVDAEALKNEENHAQAHPLPPHLASHEKRRYENDLDVSYSNGKALIQRTETVSIIQALIASVPVDTATFTLWIHQNLPSFCSDVEEVEEAYDDICRADLMRADDDLVGAMGSKYDRRSANSEPFPCFIVAKVATRHCLCFSCCSTRRSEWSSDSRTEVGSAFPRSSVGILTPIRDARNHQKIVKPQFFEYLRMKRGRQESVTAAGKWLIARSVARQGLLSLEDTQDDNESYGRWGGQLSQSVLATEIMPCLRLLKKTGAREWQDEKDKNSRDLIFSPEPRSTICRHTGGRGSIHDVRRR